MYLLLWNTFLLLLKLVTCLENGVARTPPMGWLAWERFQCNVNCNPTHSDCISERLFMEMADRLVLDGYRDVGYEYINIDDCWMSHSRDTYGNMVADPIRFPNGIKFLADYMHAKSLKLGIYQDFGTRTCMGYPGIIGHMKQDAEKFIEWDVDMVKLDGCHSKINELDSGYMLFGQLLKHTKPILYSCSWPYYQMIVGMEPNYTLISSHCNMWRNYHDINDSWKSILATINFFGDNQEVFSQYIGPGRWADPDMLMIGNRRLTPGQSRAQMGIWSIIPGPLLMSNDLREIRPWAKNILQNKEVIKINQDKLGIPGKRIYKEKGLEVWKRSILPAINQELSYALLFLNVRSDKMILVKFPLFELKLESKNGYTITEVFNEEKLGMYYPNDTLKLKINPMDVVMLLCALT